MLIAGAAQAEPCSLTSASFKDSTPMPQKVAGSSKSNPNCVGDDVSPQLSWSNAPAGTKSYALLMLDPEGRNGLGVVHWLAYNIPASVTSFAESETSKPSDKYTDGIGTAKQQIYIGPCTPPKTTYHHYTFVMVATDLDPNLPAGLTYDQLIPKLEGDAKSAAARSGMSNLSTAHPVAAAPSLSPCGGGLGRGAVVPEGSPLRSPAASDPPNEGEDKAEHVARDVPCPA